jgi:excisionase family DNA binding protein
VVVLVIDRDMAVARTVQMAPGAREGRHPSELMDDAAVRLAEMELVRRDVLDPALPRPEPALGSAEEALLRRGGFAPTAAGGPSSAPAARAQAEYASLLADSLTVEQAARLLRVNGSRVRQRLNARTLYGIKVGAAWRVPRFQLEGHAVVPGLAEVLPAVPTDVHPVALHRWLTRPSPDLTVGKEDGAASPLEWLRSGGDPARAAELARAL